jgi:hypothetical protein
LFAIATVLGGRASFLLCVCSVECLPWPQTTARCCELFALQGFTVSHTLVSILKIFLVVLLMYLNNVRVDECELSRWAARSFERKAGMCTEYLYFQVYGRIGVHLRMMEVAAGRARRLEVFLSVDFSTWATASSTAAYLCP